MQKKIISYYLKKFKNTESAQLCIKKQLHHKTDETSLRENTKEAACRLAWWWWAGPPPAASTPTGCPSPGPASTAGSRWAGCRREGGGAPPSAPWPAPWWSPAAATGAPTASSCSRASPAWGPGGGGRAPSGWSTGGSTPPTWQSPTTGFPGAISRPDELRQLGKIAPFGPVQGCQVWPFWGQKTNLAFFKNWLDSKFWRIS